ncbi:MAG: hypothetical protein JJD96_09670 [Thermoleophilia bacterium]|nr:hypothetical protein [Thermoleophilia bacterium]
MLFLCRHCKIICNQQVSGFCEDSPDNTHQWSMGEVMADELARFLSFRGTEARRVDALREQTAAFLDRSQSSSSR